MVFVVFYLKVWWQLRRRIAAMRRGARHAQRLHFSRRPMYRSASLAIIQFATALLVTGCQNNDRTSTPDAGDFSNATPRASVALRVLVVNESGLVEAINRLRGEWAEQSGGELTAVAAEWNNVAAAKSRDADVVIFPSRYLGDLCTRGWLRPMRSKVLESKAFDEADVFPLVRRVLVRWGKQVMALPLSVDIALPGISASEAISAHPAIEFLAEAAPTVISNERDGVLFDPQTMKPRIDDPAFVAALQHWSASKQQTSVPKTDAAATIPVFGFDDRLIAVTSATRNAASAFQLVEWLASAEISASSRVPAALRCPFGSRWHHHLRGMEPHRAPRSVRRRPKL